MKDVEIGTLGETRVYMRLDELVRIANRELQEHTDAIERHNSRLLYLLGVATEALKFYAELDGNGIQLYGDMDSKALEFADGQSYPFGTKARDSLKEIEHDVFDGGRFKESRYPLTGSFRSYS